MAALQLGEEIREIHGEALPWFDMHIFATGAGKAALLSRRIQILKSDPPSPMLRRDPPRRVRAWANRRERKAPLEPRSFTELRVQSGNIFYVR
jgi:hypothetical protein